MPVACISDSCTCRGCLLLELGSINVIASTPEHVQRFHRGRIFRAWQPASPLRQLTGGHPSGCKVGQVKVYNKARAPAATMSTAMRQLYIATTTKELGFFPAHVCSTLPAIEESTSLPLNRGAAREGYPQAMCNGCAYPAWRGARPILQFGLACHKSRGFCTARGSTTALVNQDG